MFGLGTTELIVILIIIVIFFGVGKLPQVAKQLGGGIRSFQKSLRGEDEDEEADTSSKSENSEKKNISES